MRTVALLVLVVLVPCAWGAAVQMHLATEVEAAAPVPRVALGQSSGTAAGANFTLAATVANGSVVMAVRPAGASTFGSWLTVGAPSGQTVTTTPVVMAEQLAAPALLWIFVQTTTGQVFGAKQSATAPQTFGPWVQIGGALPTGTPPADSNAPLVGTAHDGQLYLISRGLDGRLRSAAENTSAPGTFETWRQVDSETVATDPAATLNSFMGRLEVFALRSKDGKMVHGHLDKGSSSWSGLKELWSSQPGMMGAPVVHEYQKTGFNGQLEVFARGKDNLIHHAFEQTCDRPLKECTWSPYTHLNGDIPAPTTEAADLAVSYNIHMGLELFVRSSDGKLYHRWQIEAHSDWSDWEVVPYSTPLASGVAIGYDSTGWWEAFAIDTAGKLAVITQPRSLSAGPASFPSGSNATVSWSVPVDEATNMDWIAIYQESATALDRYLDFHFVQGEQNPLHNAVPVGNVTFDSILPAGQYVYRYLVNRQFASVMSVSVSITSGGPTKSEAEQIFDGLAKGLGVAGFDFEKCVEDGNLTVQTFKQAFIAFEDRHIFDALRLIGQGLDDFRQALHDCNETTIAQKMEQFIKDLIECTTSDCENFIIDMLKEITVLYEREYEIARDIRGASTCFGIEAYEQGAVNVGRTVAAIIEPPSVA